MRNNTKRHRFYSFKKLALLLCVLAVSLIGYWILKNSSSNERNLTGSTSSVQNIETLDQEMITIQNDTDEEVEKKKYNTQDFVTYENETVGFSFSYPKYWGDLKQVNDFDGSNGEILDLNFSESEWWINDNIDKYPIGKSLRVTTGTSSDEGLYFGGYIFKNGIFYTVPKYGDTEVEIPSEQIISVIDSLLGNVLLISTKTIVSPELQILVNLPEGSIHTGISMRFYTDDPDDNGYEKGIINPNIQDTLEAVASTFAPL